MIAAAVLAAALIATPHTTPTQEAAVIPMHQRAFAACVSERESHGNYRARRSEAGSSAAGRWQFIDRDWRHGLAFMVAARLRDHGMGRPQSTRIRVQLQATPINRWAPAYQDIAFLAALNARGPWSGWRHWYLAGSRCNALAGTR